MPNALHIAIWVSLCSHDESYAFHFLELLKNGDVEQIERIHKEQLDEGFRELIEEKDAQGNRSLHLALKLKHPNTIDIVSHLLVCLNRRKGCFSIVLFVFSMLEPVFGHAMRKAGKQFTMPLPQEIENC